MLPIVKDILPAPNPPYLINADVKDEEKSKLESGDAQAGPKPRRMLDLGKLHPETFRALLNHR